MTWDPKQCRWSPGVRLLAIILCYLVDPQALYQVEAFYETLDGELVLGPGVHASDFNDDALGRALLKFHAAHPAQVYADLSARPIATYALPEVDAVHGDTTSLTLEEDYPAADAAAEPSLPTTKQESASDGVLRRYGAGRTSRHRPTFFMRHYRKATSPPLCPGAAEGPELERWIQKMRGLSSKFFGISGPIRTKSGLDSGMDSVGIEPYV